MPTVLQFRRGPTSQNNSFTGAAGELSVDTDRDVIRVHDGSTAGGFAMLGYVVYADIKNGQSDGTGNIGNATVGFNTVHAKSTSAQYADLSEKYLCDTKYQPGTVVVLGGVSELTQCTSDTDPKVVGVVSTNPALKMNDSLADGTGGVTATHIALTGRVPCKVVGDVAVGDLLITASTPGHARAYNTDRNFVPGAIFGKAMEAHDATSPTGTIEVIVGRF